MIEKLLELNYNCSALFLLEPLGLQLKELRGVGFINSYLKFEGIDDVDCEIPLFLLFKKPIDDEGKFSDFLIGQYNKNEFLMKEDEYEHHIVLLYCFPEEFAGDYELFLMGKYSKFSREFKKKFRKIIPGREKREKSDDDYTVQYRIINKIAGWKEEVEKYFDINMDDKDELWTKMDKKKETLYLKILATKEEI